MRRTLMICLLMALVAFPLMAAAQPSGTTSPTSEYNPDAGRLMPKDAYPNRPSPQVMPSETTSEYNPDAGRLMPKDAYPNRPSPQVMPSETRSEQGTVRDAQIALRDAGYKPGRIDGVMGPTTQAAIREFQASYGLPQTGRLDDATQQQLFAARTPQSGWRR